MTEHPTPEPIEQTTEPVDVVDQDQAAEPEAERAPMKVETGELEPGYTPEPIDPDDPQHPDNLRDDAGVDVDGNELPEQG